MIFTKLVKAKSSTRQALLLALANVFATMASANTN